MPDQQQYKDPPKELRLLLDLHRVWCESEGKHGQQLRDEVAGRKFEGLRLDGAFLQMAKLHSVEWVRCSLKNVDLTLGDLEDSLFLDCDMRGAVLDESELDFVVISDGCRTEGMSLTNADIKLAQIPKAQSLLARLDLG